MERKIFCLTAALLLGSVTSAPASQEITTTRKDQKSVAVTIYNQNRALVREVRAVTLPRGKNVLAFKEVSAQIEPETARFSGPSLNVLEQHFEYDLLTPQTLLQKYEGKEVTLIKTHPVTGEESAQPATVLSTNNGVVLKVVGHIETGVPGRLVFPEIPEELRDKPTMTMLVESESDGPQDVSLSYLTTGLSWKADYVAELNDAETALAVNGWATLINQSGTSFSNATLQLVAGDVRQVQANRPLAMFAEARMAPARDSAMAEEQLSEYHLYTLDRPAFIKDGQTSQVALFSRTDVGCSREFVLTGSNYYYTGPYRQTGDRPKVEAFLHLKNSKNNHLGLPLPGGIVRIYAKDAKGNQQLAGEDRIDHTPENEDIRLKLGHAFDLAADKKQTDFKRLSVSSTAPQVYEAAFQIELRNAKKEPVTIEVVEPIPGDWQITEESLPHEKKGGNTAVWLVRVPAGGKATLHYRARVKI
jgi:hypothetical protein